MSSNVYAECVGYAFWQCYESVIGTTRIINSDDDHLQELKTLVNAYVKACDAIKDESVLLNKIDRDLISKIQNANCLCDFYEHYSQIG